MRKRIVVAVVLAVIMAASAYAQTSDFFQLVSNGTAQQVQAAIKNGADVNAQDKDGKTPLMAAVLNPNAGVIDTLLKAGANINAQQNDGGTALMYAAISNPPEMIATLLNAGTDAKAKDREGKTALDHAKDNEKLKGTDAYRQLQEASQ